MVELQRAITQNNMEQVIQLRTGVDISQRNPNAREDLAHVLETGGSSVFSSHAEGFAGEITRLASINDTAGAFVIMNAQSIPDSLIDFDVASKPMQVQDLFAGSENWLQSAQMRINAATMSLDVNYRFLHDTAPEPARLAVDSAFTEFTGPQLVLKLQQIELQYQGILTSEQSGRFGLLVGNVSYVQEMIREGKSWEEIVPIFNCDTREKFIAEASQHLDTYALNRILQVIDYVAADTSQGIETGQIMQENLKAAVEILNMLMEQANVSKELQDGISEIIKEEERKRDEEKYAAIADRMPEGLLREIGDSKDAIEFMEILSGATSYSPERAAERLEQLISENSEIREGFARFLVG